MTSRLRTWSTSALRRGGLLLALGAALAGCGVVTNLAEVPQPSDEEQDGGSWMGPGGSAPVIEGGTSSGVGATGGTASDVGGAGGAGGAGNNAGSAGASCWEPTVQNFCAQFECAPSSSPPNWPSTAEIIQHYEDTGVCDDHTVFLDRDNASGEMLHYESESTSESYLSVSGTLGATFRAQDMPFGPCNQTSYYSGITSEEWYASYGQIIERCIACGPTSDAAAYPPCRLDCYCEQVEPVTEPCSDENSCACYCERSKFIRD